MRGRDIRERVKMFYRKYFSKHDRQKPSVRIAFAKFGEGRRFVYYIIIYIYKFISEWKSRRFAIETSVFIFDDIIPRYSHCLPLLPITEHLFAQTLLLWASSLISAMPFNQFLIYFLLSNYSERSSSPQINVVRPALYYYVSGEQIITVRTGFYKNPNDSWSNFQSLNLLSKSALGSYMFFIILYVLRLYYGRSPLLRNLTVKPGQIYI